MSIFSLMETVKKKLETDDIRFIEGYGDPNNYLEEGKKGILLALDWSNLSADNFDRLNRHFDLMHLEDFVTDSETGKCYETRGAGVNYFWINRGEVIGGDRIENDPELAEYYVNTLAEDIIVGRKLNIFDIDLSEYGFRPIGKELWSGLHAGARDDPQRVYDKLMEKNPEAQIIFEYRSSNPYSVRYQAFIRDDDNVKTFKYLADKHSVAKAVNIMEDSVMLTVPVLEQIDKIFETDSTIPIYQRILDYLKQIE